MHLYFDESGDYAFPADRFDCYVQAALMCPDKVLGTVDAFVASRKAEWHVEELHAAELTSAQIGQITEFVADSEALLLAHVTDTDLITLGDIGQHRIDQAAGIKRNLEWYQRESTKARGAPVAEIEQWMDRMIKRAGLAAQISHGEFVQAQFLIHLIRDALQKAILVYSMDEWREDSWDFAFVVDGKLSNKMAAGEKYLNDVIVPVLGSQQGKTLGMLDTWKHEPVHPFVDKYSRERGLVRGQEVKGVTDLKAIFKDGLRFEASHKHAGLQLVDTVAYVIRRAVLAPDDAEVQAAYDRLRPSLRNEDGRSLSIHRLSVSDEPDPDAIARYRSLHAAERDS